MNYVMSSDVATHRLVDWMRNCHRLSFISVEGIKELFVAVIAIYC